MVRPQVRVLISGDLPAGNLPTETGTLFFIHAGATGPTTPTRVSSAAQAEDAGVTAALAAWIGDAIAQGVASVIVVRATPTGEETDPDWAGALDLLTPSWGPGQVTIPGESTTTAHSAILAHVAANPQRIGLLDAAEDATASDLTQLAAALAAEAGADRTGLIAPWVSLPGIGSSRSVPGSIIVAGLAARGDGEVGHANQAPIFDQGRAAGSVRNALGVSSTFPDREVDDLYEAGVNVIREVGGVITLTGFRSLGGDAVWRQLNIGRLTMEISAQVGSLMYQFLGAPIDGQGILLSQVGGVVTGYLLDLYNAGAVFGATPEEAFTVVCDFTNNTAETIAAGEVHADVAVTASTAAEQIVINVVTSLAS